MTFSPQRTIKKDEFTDEVTLDNGAVERNFALVSRETKQLQDKINVNTQNITRNQIISSRTNFRTEFLFS